MLKIDRMEKNLAMKKIRKWVNGLSIKKKLIFYGYLTVSPVMILISLVLLIFNYDKAKEDWLDGNLSNINVLSESLNAVQTEVKDFTTYLCINTQLSRLLTSHNIEEKNKNARLWEEETPIQYVQNVLALKGYIKTIAIYPENGIRPYLKGMDGSVYVPEIESIWLSDIYADTLKSEYRYIWRNIPKGNGELYTMNKEDKIVLCREMFDTAMKVPLGYIVIGISYKYYQNLIENVVQSENESILVLGADGNELSRYGEIDTKVEKYLKNIDYKDKKYLNGDMYFSYGSYDIVCGKIGEDDGILCKIMPRYGVWAQLKGSAYTSLILLTGVLAGMLPLFMIISNLVTMPLHQLSNAIRKFSYGDFEQKVEVATKDEIGEVADCFNSMVNAIKNLINENYVIKLHEKESEIAVLQAQINPHFLYNTLDSLYWQAIDGENEELAESILALSQLFRLVLSQGQSEILVESEMELVSCYLKIQKMRFTKRLNYSVEVAPEASEARIPKLIIQPFVENAIVHGFEKTEGKCELEVKVKREGDFVRFEIKDSGIGMTREQIDRVWKNEPERYTKQRIGRYAIRNIRERLQLIYKDNFKLDIQSVVGKGTEVTIILPFKEETGEAVKIVSRR